MLGQSPGATDATAAADTTTEVEQQQQTAVPERLGAILADMDLPEGVLTAEETTAGNPAASAEPAATVDEPAKPAAAAKPGAAAADEDHPAVPNEWPESAKRRVAEEAAKRRSRTEELKTTTTERDELKLRLAEAEKRQPVIMSPTERDPLANVTDVRGLRQTMAEYEQLKDWTTLHADGIEGVRIGGTDENPKLKDYSKEEIAEVRLHAERILRAIPAKAEFLQKHARFEPVARETYPALFEQGTQERAEYELILKQIPELTRFADFQLWIGDAIYRRNERETAAAAARESKAGKPSPTVAALLQKQPPKPPGIPSAAAAAASRQPGASKAAKDDSDVVKQREKQAIETGGDEADIEALVAAKLESGASRRGGAQLAEV